MEYIEYLILKYGYFGIVIVMAGGIIGLPIPDEILLTLVGYYIYKEKMVYILALTSSLAGAILGITVSYFLGLKLGLPFLMKYGPKVYITHKKIAFTQQLFRKFGPFLLFIGFFIPGVRHVTGYLAGIAQYRFRKMAFYAYLGSFVWVFTFITLGQALGTRWYIVEKYLMKYSFIPISTVILIIIYVYFRYRKAFKKSEDSSPNSIIKKP